MVLGVVVEVIVTVIVVVIWQYIVTVWGGVGPQMSLRCLCRALSANDAAAVVCNALFTTLGQQLFSGVRFFLVSCAFLLLDRLGKVAWTATSMSALYLLLVTCVSKLIRCGLAAVS